MKAIQCPVEAENVSGNRFECVAVSRLECVAVSRFECVAVIRFECVAEQYCTLPFLHMDELFYLSLNYSNTT